MAQGLLEVAELGRPVEHARIVDTGPGAQDDARLLGLLGRTA
jgi:hypothetical protein